MLPRVAAASISASVSSAMNILPSLQKQIMVLANKLHRPAHFRTTHIVRPDKLRFSSHAKQTYFCFTVTKNMHMSRLVIVNEDDNTQSISPEHSHYTTGLTHPDWFVKLICWAPTFVMRHKAAPLPLRLGKKHYDTGL
jgi:hypothetical protein